VLAGFIAANDDGGGGDNWSCKTCKAPIKSSPPTNTQLFIQDGCPSCRPTNSVKALKGNQNCSILQPVAYTTVISYTCIRIDSHGRPIPECQTILDFNGARHAGSCIFLYYHLERHTDRQRARETDGRANHETIARLPVRR